MQKGDFLDHITYYITGCFEWLIAFPYWRQAVSINDGVSLTFWMFR